MSNPLQEPGADLVDFEISNDGVVTNVYSDGTRLQAGPPSESVMDRQRARNIATHTFLKRKKRLWPPSRI